MPRPYQESEERTADDPSLMMLDRKLKGVKVQLGISVNKLFER